MLVAEYNGTRIDAFAAERGPAYRCPECKNEVILKKGRKVVHHFAHKPPVYCAWGKGETRAHMESKIVVAEGLSKRGYRTELEYVVSALPGDRRADVMVWSPNGSQLAFELQHTPIGLPDIERRSVSYANAGLAQIWIPFLSSKVWTEGKSKPDGWFVERYSPRLFERWVHGFNGSHGMWMYDPERKFFWHGRMTAHQYYVEHSTWYSSGGEEQSAGGYMKYSKRYKELTLNGPHRIEDLEIKVGVRGAARMSGYYWPAARVGRFDTA